ncbi:hypothetical protein TSMEX_001461 [Taenia solium]|eukprot:TsM_001026500 transcript=TsM_001026500 gene=TsM_001026500
MEQPPEEWQQVYNPRHRSNTVHRPFDLQLDANLYIDLENLPPDTPMMAFGNDYDEPMDEGIDVPLFIAGPMRVLRDIIEDPLTDSTDNFINDLDFSLIYDPTPYEPQCHVCGLVQWLLMECQNYGQCFAQLWELEQIIVFEVMREIWCRLRPKPLAFSGRHLYQALRVNYFSLPTLNLYPLPLSPFHPPVIRQWLFEGRYYTLEWTYGFMFLIHEDIESAGERAPVSCFLFANVSRILRASIADELPHVSTPRNSWLYILDAIWTRPGVALTLVMKLARTIFLTIAEMEGDWLPNPTPPPPGFRREQSMWYRRRMLHIMENILAMNVAELFHNGANPENFYQHSIHCATSPMRCFCRYARRLASTA